jgi:predicted branched-subunit amino acid permease
MVFGLAVAEGERVSLAAGWATNGLIFGGASQLASVLLLNGGGSAVLAVLTVVFINMRHLMYSAALQERFRESPTWFRWLSSYFLIDQVFATNGDRPDDEPLADSQTFFLVSGIFWWTVWAISVSVGMYIGVAYGEVIPASWGLGFSGPLMFLGLLVNAIKDRPGLVAALVSGTIAVVLQNLQPSGLNLLLGASCGLVAATVLAERRDNRSDPEAVSEVEG